jgi:hypothetical protein
MSDSFALVLVTLMSVVFVLFGWDSDGRYLQQLSVFLGGGYAGVVVCLLMQGESK